MGVDGDSDIRREPFEIVGHAFHFIQGAQFLALAQGTGRVGAGQEQHVVEHACQALKFLDIGGEQLLIVLDAAVLLQGDLGFTEQVIDRCAQLMGHVGGHLAQLHETSAEAVEHGIEGLDHR
ncbi:hypothetical protein D3C76_388160 [compost metagenome]